MADDELDDYDLDDDDDFASGKSGVPAPTDVDDDDFDFEDDFDYDGEGKGSKFKAIWEEKKKLILIGVGALVGLGAIGGGAWYFFMGDDTEVAGEEQSGGGNVGASVGLALQQQATSGLTPQSKLTAGSATGGGKLTAGGGASVPKLGAAPTGDVVPKLGAGSAATLSAAPLTATAPMATAGGMGGYDPNNAQTPLSTAAVGEVGVMIPAVLPTVANSLGTPNTPQPLALAQDESLFEPTDQGWLPVIAPDGREPWKTYARPFAGDPNQPVLGLVINGLGLSAEMTQAVIDHAPSDVTLAFSPYARGVKEWVEKARAMGHEVLLELPMESESYPLDDPGPLAVMTTKKPAENLKMVNLMMAQAQGYIGFIGQHGSKFLRDRKAMGPVLGEVKARGLFFVDPGAVEGSVTLEMADQMQLARAVSNSVINTEASSARIRAQLETLATIAKNQGLTVATMRATPNSLKILKQWAGGLQGVQLSPMSALAGRQQS